jgi:mRNA-degrading endonuclease toxin of MazEF toxin-antitoxin module
MEQWDVYYYDFPPPIGRHPVVVISPSEQAANPAVEAVNIIKITTLREARAPKKLEVALDEEDSLSHLSAARVHPIYLVLKEDLYDRQGSVCLQRRQALSRKFIEVFRFY